MNAALRNPFAVAGAIVASAAALALPASASAAVTVDASGDPITFTGDAADDNLVLSVSGGKIAHNLPAAQGFASATDLDPVDAGHPGPRRGGRQHRDPRRRAAPTSSMRPASATPTTRWTSRARPAMTRSPAAARPIRWRAATATTASSERRAPTR